MPILCEPATSSGRLLYTIGGDVRAVDSLTETARLLDRDPTEFLVVIGPRAPTNEALAFAASLRMSRPAVGVVLTRHEVDVALLTSALQSGVREVVRAGDDAALAAACRRSYEVSRRMVTDAPTDTLLHQTGTVTVDVGPVARDTLQKALAGRGLRQKALAVDREFHFTIPFRPSSARTSSA